MAPGPQGHGPCSYNRCHATKCSTDSSAIPSMTPDRRHQTALRKQCWLALAGRLDRESQFPYVSTGLAAAWGRKAYGLACTDAQRNLCRQQKAFGACEPYRWSRAFSCYPRLLSEQIREHVSEIFASTARLQRC